MTLPLIIYRSLRQHALSTLVTAVCVALASGLLMTVWMVRAQSQRAFAQMGSVRVQAVDGATADFFGAIGWFDRILMLVAVIVALVAAGSVLAGIYSSMSARQRDIAILRALGARRRTIFRAVVLEAVVIGALGAICGFIVYGVLMTVVSGIIREQTGVMIPVFAWDQVLLWTPLGMMALGALGGLAPAVKAYRVPVAQTLSPLS